MQAQFTCVHCGASFVPGSRSKKLGPPKYCSRACSARDSIRERANHMRAIPDARTCQGCGATFSVARPSSARKYCSSGCYAATNRGNRHYHYKGGQVNLLCQQCGKSFTAFPYQATRRFCSSSCYWSAMKTGKRGPTLEVACCVCQKQFRTWAYRLEVGALTCSRSCSKTAKERGEHRTCAICDTPFYASRQSIDRGQGHYCSVFCYGLARRRQNHEGRNGWQYRDWRKAVYKRDRWTCQRCGARGVELHAHHIQMWSRFPDLRFEITNGRTLCWPCHYQTHIEEGTWYLATLSA